MKLAKISTLVALLAALVIAVGVNVLVQRAAPGARLDLTQGKIYTLSQGTKSVLQGLKEPVTLRLFYSRKLGSVIPSYGAFADRVHELLDQYARISGGMLKVEFYDPEPYSDTEDRALAYGLQGVPLDQGGEQVYFGLAGTNQVDTEKKIAFFKTERESFLEYDLTKLVYELSEPERPQIGLITSLPIQGDPRAMMMGQKTQPWVSLSEMQNAFTVKQLPTDSATIDPAIKTVIVVHPQNLPQSTLYAIDQFVMRGGKLMVMVDPHSEMQAAQPTQGGMPNTNTSSDMPKLFEAWGIVYDPKHIVADLNGAWRVRSSNASDRVQSVEYIAWLNLRDGLSHNDPATADLNTISVASAGEISLKDGSGLTLTPLLTTSADRSGTVPVELVQVAPNPAQILANFKPDGRAHVVAARLTGPLKSAFTEAPKPSDDKEPAKDAPVLPPHIAATNGAANLIVIADSDLMGDRFWVRIADFFGDQTAVPFADNGAFVSNLTGTLAGGDALLGLRSRGVSARPFDYIDHMTQDADARYRQTAEGLTKHLEDLQKQLTSLRGTVQGASQTVLSPAQTAAIEDARKDVLETRKQLRAVQLDLRRDIAYVEGWLKIINIALVPAILAIVVILLALAQARRRARARS